MSNMGSWLEERLGYPFMLEVFGSFQIPEFTTTYTKSLNC